MGAVLLEQLFTNLRVQVAPFATCSVQPGWRLRLDGLEWVTLHFVLQGTGVLRLGPHDQIDLHPQMLVLLPERRAHGLQASNGQVTEVGVEHSRQPTEGGPPRFLAGADDPGNLLVACGRLQAIYAGDLGLFDMLSEPVALDFSDDMAMQHTFDRLLAESTTSSPGSQTMLTALMNECLVLVFRQLCDSPQCRLPWLLALENPQLTAVLERVLERPGDPHSTESLADVAGMSRSTFSREFGDSFGQTPMAFVRGVRLRRAAELLRTSSLTIDAVARRVGFASRSHFSQLFAERFGQPPTVFREAASSDS